jgi:hypothetical protein
MTAILAELGGQPPALLTALIVAAVAQTVWPLVVLHRRHTATRPAPRPTRPARPVRYTPGRAALAAADATLIDAFPGRW